MENKPNSQLPADHDVFLKAFDQVQEDIIAQSPPTVELGLQCSIDSLARYVQSVDGVTDGTKNMFVSLMHNRLSHLNGRISYAQIVTLMKIVQMSNANAQPGDLQAQMDLDALEQALQRLDEESVDWSLPENRN